MIYADYLTQENPRHPVYVTIEDDDYYQRFNVFNGFIIVLKILGIYYSYWTEKDGGTMWTMDDDGNKRSPSVFNYKPE